MNAEIQNMIGVLIHVAKSDEFLDHEEKSFKNELRLVPGTTLQGDFAVLTAGSALPWTYPKPTHPPKGPPFDT